MLRSWLYCDFKHSPWMKCPRSFKRRRGLLICFFLLLFFHSFNLLNRFLVPFVFSSSLLLFTRSLVHSLSLSLSLFPRSSDTPDFIENKMLSYSSTWIVLPFACSSDKENVRARERPLLLPNRIMQCQHLPNRSANGAFTTCSIANKRKGNEENMTTRFEANLWFRVKLEWE